MMRRKRTRCYYCSKEGTHEHEFPGMPMIHFCDTCERAYRDGYDRGRIYESRRRMDGDMNGEEMSKTVCDRCGKRFGIVIGTMLLEEYRAEDEGGRFGCEASARYCLCPDCSDAFRAFGKGGRKE